MKKKTLDKWLIILFRTALIGYVLVFFFTMSYLVQFHSNCERVYQVKTETGDVKITDSRPLWFCNK